MRDHPESPPNQNPAAADWADRAKRANIEKALEILSRAGQGEPPMPGDELEEE